MHTKLYPVYSLKSNLSLFYILHDAPDPFYELCMDRSAIETKTSRFFTYTVQLKVVYAFSDVASSKAMYALYLSMRPCGNHEFSKKKESSSSVCHTASLGFFRHLERGEVLGLWVSGPTSTDWLPLCIPCSGVYHLATKYGRRLLRPGTQDRRSTHQSKKALGSIVKKRGRCPVWDSVGRRLQSSADLYILRRKVIFWCQSTGEGVSDLALHARSSMNPPKYTGNGPQLHHRWGTI